MRRNMEEREQMVRVWVGRPGNLCECVAPNRLVSRGMCVVGTYVLTYGLAYPASALVTSVSAHNSVIQIEFDAQKGTCKGWSRKVRFGQQD